MSISMMNDLNLVAVQILIHKKITRLQKIIQDWISLRSCMLDHLDKYEKASTNSHVPYHVWSRHGAYLEMNMKMRRR